MSTVIIVKEGEHTQELVVSKSADTIRPLIEGLKKAFDSVTVKAGYYRVVIRPTGRTMEEWPVRFTSYSAAKAFVDLIHTSGQEIEIFSVYGNHWCSSNFFTNIYAKTAIGRVETT